MLVFDCETNGFLEQMDRIHCLIVKDTFTGVITRYNDQPGTPAVRRISAGVQWLMDATKEGECISPHNGIRFDIPALQKIYPWFKPDMRYVLDTMVMTRLLWPELKDIDRKLIKKGQMPTAAKFRPHALETWGYRLKLLKDEYSGDPAIADEAERKARKWEYWNPTMEDYCVQDVEVTDVLLWRCLNKIVEAGFSAECIEVEHHVARIITRQERYGFAFDVAAAGKLYGKLVDERLGLEAALMQQYGQFYVRDHASKGSRVAGAAKGTTCHDKSRRVKDTDADDNPIVLRLDAKGKPVYRTTDFTAGVPYTKLKLLQFNPTSRDHIANRLTTLYGWKPTEFTDDGKPKVDEAVLAHLRYPGIDGLKRYLMVQKRIGQLAEGKEAWLKHVRDGRIYGSVNSCGAVTGRMTHSKPNTGQVPAVRSPFGVECRALYTATPNAGKVLVGADAAGLELRDLAGYMARFDGGDYVRIVLDSDSKEAKAAGRDMHSVNCRALGMDPKEHPFGDSETGRDVAKTWFYAFIYGAGDEKLGLILTHKQGQQARGAKSKADFMKNLPALGKLVERVRNAVRLRKQLIGLDGRILVVRSQHSALNTLLQSAGAVQMKRALIILDTNLQAMGLIPGVQYEFVANVHDEWQIECDEPLGDTIGKAAVAAIVAAGEHFNFKCPLGGAYKIGRNWAETH